MQDVQRVGVVGLGTMGAGIAQIAAQSGIAVVGVTRSSESIERARRAIAASLPRLVKRGDISQDQADAAIPLIDFTVDLEQVAECDIVIEAVYEDIPLKQEIFAKLDKLCASQVPIVTNTSTIPAVIMARATESAHRVVGMHFFNPVPIMKLVEVIEAPAADEDTIAAVCRLAERVGKTPVRVKDVPGFVGNQIIVPFLLDAIRVYGNGVADAESIDAVMRLGYNHPMGPLAVADLIGLDVLADMADTMYAEYKDPRYVTPTRLVQLIRMGQLGRKTGRGFYTYKT